MNFLWSFVIFKFTNIYDLIITHLISWIMIIFLELFKKFDESSKFIIIKYINPLFIKSWK